MGQRATWMGEILSTDRKLQEFLVEAGHEDEGISRNSEWETPLMIAAEARKVEVGALLIDEFPRCVPWFNKMGMDAVRMIPSIVFALQWGLC